MGFVLLIIAVGAFVGGIYYGKAIARPIEIPRDAPKRPFQFFMSDILWLFVLLQPAMMLLAAARGPGSQGLGAIAGYLVFIGGAVWLVGIRTLSRLGIVDAARRAVFLLVFLPLFIAASAGMMVAIAGTAGWVVAIFTMRGARSEDCLVGPAALFVLLPTGIGCHQLAKWIRAGAAAEDASSKAPADDAEPQL